MTVDKSDQELHHVYMECLPRYQRLVKEVKFVLATDLSNAKIKVHVIQTRIKEFPEMAKKIERKEVHDLAGVRVICLYRSDMSKVCDLIRKRFDVKDVDRKSLGAEAGQFGYVSDHYIVSLPDSFSGVRYDDLKGLECEIQVRTMLMHAWAAVAHHLQYKKEDDIPAEIKRDFHALSAVFHLADGQFDVIRAARERVKDVSIQIGEGKTLKDLAVNLDSLFAFLRTRMHDRQSSPITEYSALVSELLQAGYSRLSELGKALDQSQSMLKQYEKGGLHHTDVGAVRLSLALIDNRFARLTHLHPSQPE